MRPQKISVLLGTYLSISILLFSSGLLFWAYKSARDVVDRELKCGFIRRHNIAQNIIYQLCERVEKNLTNIRSNPNLVSILKQKKLSSKNGNDHKGIYQLLSRNAEAPLDILFVSRADNSLWLNASKPLFEIDSIFSEITPLTPKILLGAKIELVKNGNDTTPILLKALPILHQETGNKLGTLYGGIVLENNLNLMEMIRKRTDCINIAIFKKGDLIGATEVMDSTITQTLVTARKSTPADHLYLSQASAITGVNGIIAHWRPVILFGKASSIELAVSIPNTSIHNLKNSYIKKGTSLFLFSTLFLFFTIFIIKKLTFSPLTNLLEYADTISSGKFSANYNKSFVKEFNKLGTSMEEMVQKLSETNKQLLADIVKRKAYEKALNESKERYRTLHDNVQVAVYRITPRGKIISVNQSGVEMTGFASKEALLACNVRSLFIDTTYQTILFERLKKDRKIRGYECCFIKKDGGIFWGSVYAVMVFDEYENLVYIDGILEDITKRKEAEKEREKYQQRLRQTHKLEAIGTLAGGIAHDFNNILSAIIGYTEMATDLVDHQSILHEYLNEIFKGGIRASDLVKQILAFSRQGDHDIKPLFIKNIIKEALKLLRPSLPSTIEIHLKLNDNPTILADPTQIHQVMINLVTNAAYAMERSGGRLNIEINTVRIAQEFAIRHPHVTAGTYCKLTVQDTGCGMSSSVTDRIFYPFFTTKEKGEGTGMGLAVVHGIVKKHKGFITVYSEKSVGSAFHVFFPIAKAKNPQFAKSDELIPRGSERIMVVDDERIIAEMGKKMLESLGYQVKIWDSSEEALNYFQENPDQFDLVITDMTMPKLTGKQIAMEMIKIRPDIPIILCTGFSMSIDDKEAKALGIRAFIFKPILKTILAKSVRQILDNPMEIRDSK